MIGMAIVLIVVAAIFGVKSFRELSAEEPPSALTLPPRSEPAAVAAPAEPAGPAEGVEPFAPVASDPSVAPQDSPAPPVVAVAPAPTPFTNPAATLRPNAPQVAPPQVFAFTRVRSAEPPAPVAPADAAAAFTTANSPVDEAVLLDEVETLERRGDEIMAERRTEDALDLYSTALESAIEYAARKGANSAAKDQVVKLQRKLGLLQIQNASTAEARSSYQQARKTLLKLKSQGEWSRERAKSLDEMESRILSLPRD